MSGSALYDKYRPTDFSQVVGKRNKESAKILQGLVDNPKEVNHAVLLIGESGIGKTTLARITASKLLEIEKLEKCMAYCEYNMSDKTGVADVREICESSQSFGVSKNRRKCIVLDEFHNVSRQGQDAILKYIEDVRPHLFWFIVTDAAEKLDKAILGRCLNIKLERPKDEEIAELLVEIAEKEDKTISEESANIIASGSDNIRSAINVLEIVLSSGNKSPEEVSSLVVSSNEDGELFKKILMPLVWPYMLKEHDVFSHDYILSELDKILESNKATDLALQIGGWARKRLLNLSYKTTSKGKEKKLIDQSKEKRCYLHLLKFYCDTQWHLQMKPENKFVFEFLMLVDRIKKVHRG